MQYRVGVHDEHRIVRGHLRHDLVEDLIESAGLLAIVAAAGDHDRAARWRTISAVSSVQLSAITTTRSGRWLCRSSDVERQFDSVGLVGAGTSATTRGWGCGEPSTGPTRSGWRCSAEPTANFAAMGAGKVQCVPVQGWC